MCNLSSVCLRLGQICLSFYAIFGSVCFQFTHLSFHDFENLRTSAYYRKYNSLDIGQGQVMKQWYTLHAFWCSLQHLYTRSTIFQMYRMMIYHYMYCRYIIHNWNKLFLRDMCILRDGVVITVCRIMRYCYFSLLDFNFMEQKIYTCWKRG